MTSLAPLILLTTLAGRGGASVDDGLHPQDGPDADVRVFIEDTKVRVQVVVNLAFVDELVGAPRELQDWLDPVEYPIYEDALFEYFSRVNAVRAHGEDIEPVAAEFEVGEPEMSLLPNFPKMGMRALIRLRSTFDYPLESPAQEIELVWGAYPPDALAAEPGQEPPPMVITAQLTVRGEEILVPFKAAEPSYVWIDTGDHRESRYRPLPERGAAGASGGLPLVSAGLVLLWLLAAVGVQIAAPAARRKLWLAAPAVLVAAVLTSGLARVEAPGFPAEDGAAALDEEYAVALFETLHHNMYRAFDYRDVDRIYEALARSVEGDLLQELFAEVYDSMVLHEDGGAVCRIKEVTPLSTEILADERRDGARHIDVAAHWQVFGSVFHWGHTHTRTNEVKAEYSLRHGEDGWRISSHQILEQQTTDASPGAPEPAPFDPEREL